MAAGSSRKRIPKMGSETIIRDEIKDEIMGEIRIEIGTGVEEAMRTRVGRMSGDATIGTDEAIQASDPGSPRRISEEITATIGITTTVAKTEISGRITIGEEAVTT